MSHELYEILGVSKSASQEEVKKAYRDAVMKWHPDRNAGNPEAEERFKAISFAYETLGDPTQRQLYDLSVDLPNGTSVNPDEVARLFSAVFGSFMDENFLVLFLARLWMKRSLFSRSMRRCTRKCRKKSLLKRRKSIGKRKSLMVFFFSRVIGRFV
jgi:curved DNA-binding protein CbpA